MERIARFEKVSYEQFKHDIIEAFNEEIFVCDDTDSVGGPTEKFIQTAYDNIQLPTRATSGSAGYDFKLPFGVNIGPSESVKIPTGIRVSIDPGWWLGCFPKSGLGFKYRMQLDNTVGVIDSDYYYSQNEGHILAKVTNDGNDGDDICLSAGDKFIQAIFLPYGITRDDEAKGIRNGGFGSTGK